MFCCIGRDCVQEREREKERMKEREKERKKERKKKERERERREDEASFFTLSVMSVCSRERPIGSN